MRRWGVIFWTGLIVACAVPATAAPIVLQGRAPQTIDGEVFTFDFADLVSPDGSAGTFTVWARGDYGDNEHEYLSWSIDGLLDGFAGGFLPTGRSHGDPFDFVIHHGLNDVEFQRTYEIGAPQLDALVGDGLTSIFVGLDRYVNAPLNSAAAFVDVKLTYHSVPEPGALLLFGIALTGLAARSARWRRM